MHPDPGFHHRLAAQTYRFLQQVAWISLEVLSRRSQLDAHLKEELRHTRAAQDWLAAGRQRRTPGLTPPPKATTP